MQGEKEKVRDTTEGSGQQQAITPRDEEPNPVGQDSAKNEYGEIGDEAVEPGAGSAPPRSLGTKGQEFGHFADPDRTGQQGQSGTGQADLGSQAGSTLSGHTDQQDLGETGGEMDQPGSVAGGRQSNTEGEGFILQQGSRSDDPRQSGGTISASSAKAAEGTDFARQGRGASEEEDDETGIGAGSSGVGSDDGSR